MEPRRWAPPLLYAAVTLAVAGPLLGAGYVFALDHAMGPRSADYYGTYFLHNEDAIQNKGAYAALLVVLTSVMPAWAAQKLILFGPFFLAGLGAHRLAARHASWGACLFAGLLYMLGPFAYLRGVSGQSGVLWAYALAPWFFAAWLAYAQRRDRKSLAACVLLVAATAVFQAHGVALLVLLVGVHALVRLARRPSAWREALAAPLALAAWSVAVNAAWLVPVALADRTTLGAIGDGDLAAFATTTAGLPSVGLAALTLQGFWRDAYPSPYGTSLLLLIPALVLVLALRGLARRRHDHAAPTLALAGLLGLLLAIGTSAPATAWLFELAWEHVPGMRGFRDAHKLLALLALAYADLAASGADALLETLPARRTGPAGRVAPAFVLAALLALPVAGAAPLLGGYGGTLRLADYPEGWTEVEAATASCDGSMLVLPWHLYLDLGFLPQADKRVTNPAKLYFTCPTLTSDHLGLAGGADQASTPSIRYADHWMRHAAFVHGNPRGIETLGNLLSPVGVRYVLLLKESDWATVAPELERQRDLRLVLDNPDARLYENLAAPVQGRVDRVVPIASWDDLLPLSRAGPLAGATYPMGEAGVAPATLVIPPPRAPATAWRMEGRLAASTSLGFVPAFAPPPPGIDDAEAPRLPLLGWGLSLGSLAALALWSRHPERTLIWRGR